MGDHKARLGPDGTLVVPAELLGEAGLRPGDLVVIRVDGRAIRVMDDVAGLLALQRRVAERASDRSLVEILRADRRRDAARQR